MGAKQHKKKVLRTGPIPIGVPVTIYGLSSFFDGSYLPSTKLEPRWILTSPTRSSSTVNLDKTSIGSKQHKKKVLRTGPIPIGVPVTIYGLSSFFDGSYLPSTKLEPRWILTSALGKTPMGNRYSSDILEDKMYIEGRNSADSGAGPSNAAVSAV